MHRLLQRDDRPRPAWRGVNKPARQSVMTFGLCGLGGVALIVVELAAWGFNLPEPRGEPVVLVAWPWGMSAAEIAERGGGRVIGPETSTLTAVVADASVDALEQAGAMLVLDETFAKLLCGTNTGT